ncbi:hypothetical protein ACS0TY_030329 [Phlomoides rotata]
MSSMKLDVEKFTGKNDFGLWKVKMKALLVHHGLASALKTEESEKSSATAAKKVEINEKAHSAIILCLGDKPLREVSKEKTVIDVWRKLESLYQTKSVSNKLYVKQKLLDFRMSEGKDLNEKLDTFNKYIDDLEDLDVKMEDDDKALMLLNALPKSLDSFKDSVLFGNQDGVILIKARTNPRNLDLLKEGSVTAVTRLGISRRIAVKRKVTRLMQLWQKKATTQLRCLLYQLIG